MTANRRFRPTPLAAKIAAAAALMLLAECIFDPASRIGSVVGVLALVWSFLLVATRPFVLRDRRARIAMAAAAAYAVVLVDDPGALAWVLCWVALSLAALLPRRRFGDASVWLRRLAWHAVIAVRLPWRDLAWARAARRRREGGGVRATATILIVPVVGGALFLTLFAAANPLIGNALDRIVLPDLWTVIWRTLLAMFVLTGAWATLRPRLGASAARTPEEGASPAVYDLGVASIVLSLATFNAIFALQNVLDIVFLSSGAALPEGVTMADYAHRGAYTLIATALLAGLFVLVTLRPGGTGATNRTVRWLVTLWIVQNLLLVAFSALRLFDYIQSYSMTTLRLSALLWMVLVAVGLALILWRLLHDRSAAWLINGNAIAAAVIVSAASVVDLGATSAAWNARAALAGGTAPRLDTCYLAQLGPSALVSLARLERAARDPAARDALASLRWDTQAALAERQANWRSWTFRDARRLAATTALVGANRPRLRPAPDGRFCGEILPPSPPSPVAAATPEPRPDATTQLTKAAQR